MRIEALNFMSLFFARAKLLMFPNAALCETNNCSILISSFSEKDAYTVERLSLIVPLTSHHVPMLILRYKLPFPFVTFPPVMFFLLSSAPQFAFL